MTETRTYDFAAIMLIASEQTQNKSLNFHGPYKDCHTCSGSGSYPQNVGWSGFWASESSPGYWQYSQMEWYIPTVASGNQPGVYPDTDDLSDWGGIGDPATACELIQTGTVSIAQIWTGFWTAEYDAWWEDLCDPNQGGAQNVDFYWSVNPGDDMLSEVYLNGSLIFCDLSADGGAGECISYADYNYPTDGHTFMCIQEQPTGRNAPPPLVLLGPQIARLFQGIINTL